MPIASTNHRGEWNLHYWWETKCSAELTLLWTCLMFLIQKKNQKKLPREVGGVFCGEEFCRTSTDFLLIRLFQILCLRTLGSFLCRTKELWHGEAATILFSFKNVQFLWYIESKAMQKMFYIVWIGRWCWTHQYIERTWSSQLTEARNM